ncbi:MAG TPA: hypothetical protein VIR30_05450 [Nocardioides sp.]
MLALLRNARSSSRKTLVRMIDSRVDAVTTRVNVLHARTNKAARVVRHGNRSTTARPAWAGSVIWVGSVVPKNRRSGDVFMWEA